LATTQEQYRLLAEESSDFTLRTVGDFVVEWVSPSVTAALGWKSEEIVGRSGLEFFHPNDVAGTVQRANEMSNGAASSGRIRLRCSDGGYRWFSQVARPVFDDEGRLVARISGFQDVDAEVRAERALARSERRFRLAMESAPTGMAVVDLDRCFLEVNPALCRMLRRDEPWVLARSMADVLAADEVESDERMHADVLTGQTRSARAAKRLITADGDHVWVEHSLGLLSDDDGRPVSFVSQFLDVTAAHQAQERLRFLADHDVLTSLANRHQLLDRVGAILGHRPRMGGRLAILFVDLDNFKPVNDTYGHAAGDVVLVEVARRITSAVRSDDVVARIGGDEFVVAMSPVRSVQDAESVAGKLHMQLKPAISIGGAQVTVGASIGLTLAEPGDDADRLLKRADEALYLAKSQGRNRTVVHQGTQEP
jgi:diguanylate cyclase (GGDEF)-like protein/PAS domain S-box-containing protein